jgi:hypothetical protein
VNSLALCDPPSARVVTVRGRVIFFQLKMKVRTIFKVMSVSG